LNDTAIGVHVSVWINHWSWSGSWSSRCCCWGASARAATSWCCVASDRITSALVLENLAEQASMTLSKSAAAIASWGCTWITSSDFSAAGWAVSARSSDFSTAGWASATSSDFSAAGWSTTRIASTSLQSSELAFDVSADVSLSIVQFALQALELVKNRSAAHRATTNFNAAAWASSSCTWVTCWSSNFCTARWTLSTAISARSCDFSSARWISNSGIAAGASSSATMTTHQSMQQVATEALSAKASTQNHRSNKNVPLHRTKSPYVHWVTDRRSASIKPWWS